MEQTHATPRSYRATPIDLNGCLVYEETILVVTDTYDEAVTRAERMLVVPVSRLCVEYIPCRPDETVALLVSEDGVGVCITGPPRRYKTYTRTHDPLDFVVKYGGDPRKDQMFKAPAQPPYPRLREAFKRHSEAVEAAILGMPPVPEYEVIPSEPVVAKPMATITIIDEAAGSDLPLSDTAAFAKHHFSTGGAPRYGEPGFYRLPSEPDDVEPTHTVENQP